MEDVIFDHTLLNMYETLNLTDYRINFYGQEKEGDQLDKVVNKMMIDYGEYSMSRFANMYGFTYEGMATNKSEAKALKEKLK